MIEALAKLLVSAERMAIFKAISELDLERTKYMTTGIGGLALEKFRKRLIELRDSSGVVAKDEEIGEVGLRFSVMVASSPITSRRALARWPQFWPT